MSSSMQIRTIFNKAGKAEGAYRMNAEKRKAASRLTEYNRKTGPREATSSHNEDIAALSNYSITYSPAHEGHILSHKNEILFTSSDRAEVVEEYQRRAELILVRRKSIGPHHHS